MTIGDYIGVVKETGGFVGVGVAAILAGVSRQRMGVLVRKGRVPSVCVMGQRLVKLPGLQAWADTRKVGKSRAIAPR